MLCRYEDIVVSLATKKSLLQSAKDRVIKGVKDTNLFHTQDWARSLERASMMMWEVSVYGVHVLAHKCAKLSFPSS